jgi:hypothetical protein
VLGALDGAIDNLATRLASLGAKFERSGRIPLATWGSSGFNVAAAEIQGRGYRLYKAVTDLKMYGIYAPGVLSQAGKLISRSLLDYVK